MTHGPGLSAPGKRYEWRRGIKCLHLIKKNGSSGFRVANRDGRGEYQMRISSSCATDGICQINSITARELSKFQAGTRAFPSNVIRSWARYFLTRSAIPRPTCSPDGARAESGRDFWITFHFIQATR